METSAPRASQNSPGRAFHVPDQVDHEGRDNRENREEVAKVEMKQGDTRRHHELGENQDDGLDELGIAHLLHDLRDVVVVGIDRDRIGPPVRHLIINRFRCPGQSLHFLPVERRREGQRHQRHAKRQKQDDPEKLAEQKFRPPDRFGQNRVDGPVMQFLRDELRGGQQRDGEAEQPDRPAAEILHELDLRVEEARGIKAGRGQLRDDDRTADQDQAEDQQNVQYFLAHRFREGVAADGDDAMKAGDHLREGFFGAKSAWPATVRR